MHKRNLAVFMAFLFTLSIAVVPVYAGSKTPLENYEKSFSQLLSPGDLNMYQKAIEGITDDGHLEDFITKYFAKKDSKFNNEGIQLLGSEINTTSILKNEVEGIRNYEAFIFVEDTYRIINDITPLSLSSEEEYDSTYSVKYLIVFDYDRIYTPIPGMHPNRSTIKIISTNSGVQVSKAEIHQKAWGEYYVTSTGDSGNFVSYSRIRTKISPTTGIAYNYSFAAPSSYFFNIDTPGQCGFGVILTLQRSSPSTSWEYATGFLGYTSGSNWSPGIR
jgi:hypothetical protein